MKHTLLHNLKFIVFGLAVAISLGIVAAAPWAEPSSVAPEGNIAAPLHTGPSQIKSGGLSVDTFLAAQNAQFGQQVFFTGMVRGGTSADTDSTVRFGTGGMHTNMTATGDVSAVGTIASSSVANANSSALCATAEGTIVTCTPGVSVSPVPSLTLNSDSYSGSVRTDVVQVGKNVSPGNVFTISIYVKDYTVTAVAGDTYETIANKLIVAINNGTWGSNVSGTYGLKPSASSVSAGNGDLIKITLDSANRVSLYASAK
ncbi:MAG: hypothetical protein V4478_01595 [Patescibacteria group bacterium]